MTETISIGYTRIDRRPGSDRDYIPAMDGYQPGAAQDIVTIALPAGSRLPQLPMYDLAEAVFVATNAPAAGFHGEVHGAREVITALANRTPGSRRWRSLSVGDTVTANGRTVAYLPAGFADVPGYRPPDATKARTPGQADFLATVIITAVEGGINYWASVSGYRWHDPHLDGGSAYPGPGGSANAYVTVHETPRPGRTFIIGLDAIEDALAQIAAGPVADMSEPRRERIRRVYGGDGDARTELDSDDAEEVMQVACFGRVIYG